MPYRALALLIAVAAQQCATGAAEPADPVKERFIVDAGVKLQVEPEYPPAALAARTDGEVTVAFTIDIHGGVRAPKVVASQPPAVFDDEVLATIAFWRFEPASEPRECRRLEQTATQTFRFRSAAPEDKRIEIPPTVVDGIPSPERPVIRASTRDEIIAAAKARYPQYPIPKANLVPIKRVEPDWPRDALIDRISGFVTTKFVVTEQGTVENVEIKESQPKGLFDRVAKDAVRRWRFEPPTEDGRPTTVNACQTLEFRMVN